MARAVARYLIVLLVCLPLTVVAKKKTLSPEQRAKCGSLTAKKRRQCVAELKDKKATVAMVDPAVLLAAAQPLPPASTEIAGPPSPRLSLKNGERIRLGRIAGEPEGCVDSARVSWLSFLACVRDAGRDAAWEHMPEAPGVDDRSPKACVDFANQSAERLQAAGREQCERLIAVYNLPPRAQPEH
jgi:hypothetical protein